MTTTPSFWKLLSSKNDSGNIQRVDSEEKNFMLLPLCNKPLVSMERIYTDYIVLLYNDFI